MNQRQELDNKKPRPFTVLVSDPGGTGVMMPVCFLEEIQKRSGGLPIPEMFDLALGASSSALLIALLTRPDPREPTKPMYDAETAKLRLRRFSRIVFQQPRSLSSMVMLGKPKFEAKHLERLLKKALGETKLNELLTSVVFSAAAIDRHHQPVWMTHIKGKKDTSPEAWSTMRAWQAVRAAASVPFHFDITNVETTPENGPPQQHALMDGGFFSGNNLRHALNLAKKMAPEGAEIVVVHLGTGITSTPTTSALFNKRGLLGLMNRTIANLMSTLLFRAATADSVQEMKEELGDRFFSFNFIIDPRKNPGDPTPDFDDGSRDNMLRYERRVKKEIAEKDGAEIDRFCKYIADRSPAPDPRAEKNPDFAEKTSPESDLSCRTLAAMLEQQKSTARLKQLYFKIVLYSDFEAPAAKADEKLHELCKNMREREKDRLDQIYHEVLEKKSAEGGLFRKFTSKAAKNTPLFPTPAPANDDAGQERKTGNAPKP